MTEKSFQTTLIRNINAYPDWQAYNMETMSQPGFPDIAAFNRKEYRLLEVKAREVGPRVKVKNLLTLSQLPWWLFYHKNGGGSLFLVVKTSAQRIIVSHLSYEVCKAIQWGMLLQGLCDHERTREFQNTHEALEIIL